MKNKNLKNIIDWTIIIICCLIIGWTMGSAI